MSACFRVGIVCDRCGFELPHALVIDRGRYAEQLRVVREVAAERGWTSHTISRSHRDICSSCSRERP